MSIPFPAPLRLILLALVGSLVFASPALAAPKANKPTATTQAPKRSDGRYSVLVTMKEAGLPPLRAGDPQGAKRRTDLIRTRMLAALDRHAPAAAATARAGRKDKTFEKFYSELPIMHLYLTDAEILAWRADPEVLAVERDTIEQIKSLPTSTSRINAPTLWNQGIEGSGFAVVTMDTGADHNHTFVNSRITRSACFSTGSGIDTDRSFCANNGPVEIGAGAGRTCQGITTSGGTQYDGCTHGTHVTGITAGRDTTQSGVARAANIWAYQIFFGGEDDEVTPAEPTAFSKASDGLAAMNDVIARASAGDQVASINLSLGGGEFQTACDDISRAVAVNSLANLGVATVIAAGNESFNDAVSSPGCISNAITVGASDSRTTNETIASFSNTSPLVDVVAPGVGISSSTTGPSTFGTMSGTSQATPHVAGAVAVLRSFRPSASVRDITEAIAFTGPRITDSSSGFTFHRLDLAAAQQFLQQGLRIASSNAPTARFTTNATNVSTVIINLINSSTSTISWTASEASAFLSLSATSGSLAPSANTNITVTVDPNAFAAFRQTGFVVFTGTENGVSRSFEVPVHAIRAEPPPANDPFNAPVVLIGSNPSTTGTNRQATLEAGEPRAINNDAGTATVWWNWTAPATGLVTVDTVGSDFDTVLAAYTGNAVNTLTLIAENDDIVLGSDVDSRISFTASAGTNYRLQVNGFGSATGAITLRVSQAGVNLGPPPVAAVLPYARAVSLNQPATGFAVMLNSSGIPLSNCAPAISNPSVAAGSVFTYQTTNSANQLVGTGNTPAGLIPIGGQQNFVFGITPSLPLSQAEIGISIACTGAQPSTVVNGVNSFILSSQASALPDLVAIAATTSNDGIVAVPNIIGQSAAFSVAAVNIGASGTITATAERGPLTPAVTLLVCRTDSAGQCRPGEGPASQVSTNIANGETALFAVFLQNAGPIPFDPANNRVFLRLRNSNAITVGATNVAVRSP